MSLPDENHIGMSHLFRNQAPVPMNMIRIIAVTPGNIQTLIRRQTETALPGENSMSNMFIFSQMWELKPGQALMAMMDHVIHSRPVCHNLKSTSSVLFAEYDFPKPGPPACLSLQVNAGTCKKTVTPV
jgi:hypothetical protein